MSKSGKVSVRKKGTAEPEEGSAVISLLKDLPDRLFTITKSDRSGIQFFTAVSVGICEGEEVMLDGGSGVNSVTEEIIVRIINDHRAAGIKLSDKRHPILALERWEEDEALRGVAGGKTVPLIGAVVVRMNMTAVGSNCGPAIKARFKVCRAGSTDWVGWILGARALESGLSRTWRPGSCTHGR
jgi:hypothetical protein